MENRTKNKISNQVKTDLHEIIDICMNLIGISDEVFTKKSDENRAYKILLALRHEFEEEIQKIELEEEIPF